MLGAIIGDIVGSRYEFNPTNDYNFEMFAEGSGFTDDTVCTIAVADAIIKGRDYGKSIHEWCRKYPNPKGGYGGRFRKWVMSNNPKPYGSFGNGSAMRVSPIGWWSDNIFEACDEAKKSAECTHNHEEGINGAQAVAVAIRECYEMRQELHGEKPSRDTILSKGLYHAINLYVFDPYTFKIDLDKYRNKFDETCQGTVPVALWIVLNSTSFEDAIRKAVSLGADADTLGAIVGSIAEVVWGIPEWMKKKAMSYLPKEMVNVVNTFHQRINRLRKLTERCEYYKIDEFNFVSDEHQLARKIEKEWANDLARSYRNADNIKAEMARLCGMEHWQAWADQYDLPVSLIGYIFKHTSDCGMFMHERVEPFEKFLRMEYAKRIPLAEKKKTEKEKIEQMQAIMHWKLGLGNMGKFFNGENPMPSKDKIATEDSWKTEPWSEDSDDWSVCEVNIRLPREAMNILRKGHIPDAQEDHWFMYVDSEYIRYYRSWTGMPAFKAHYKECSNGYVIDSVKMNKALCEFGVNGDVAGVAIFNYLIVAEIGGDFDKAWKDYLSAWEYLNKKYAKK